MGRPTDVPPAYMHRATGASARGRAWAGGGAARLAQRAVATASTGPTFAAAGRCGRGGPLPPDVGRAHAARLRPRAAQVMRPLSRYSVAPVWPADCEKASVQWPFRGCGCRARSGGVSRLDELYVFRSLRTHTGGFVHYQLHRKQPFPPRLRVEPVKSDRRRPVRRVPRAQPARRRRPPSAGAEGRD